MLAEGVACRRPGVPASRAKKGRTMTPPRVPNVLSIAGSDPSGGAGIQADLKAISANGGYAMAAITALTAQNTKGVNGVQRVPAAFVAAQIRAVLADVQTHAIKIGMMGSAETVRAVATELADHAAPVVLDPVMVAKGGSPLADAETVAALRHLLPRVTVLTPNLPEAAALLHLPEAQSRDAMLAQAQALRGLGCAAVLLKGGHLPGDHCPDLLLQDSGVTWFDGPRHATRNTHGTGCTLSSALATQIARGLDLVEACRAAKNYTAAAIAAADGLQVGRGHGPTDHFFALR